jgi:putative nucleotidyltransferase with HDIG domain
MFSSIKKPSRLGQWNGRRRSSRSAEPMLPHLWRRSVLVRLATVLVTAVALTFLTYRWGPPLPYRVGEVYSWDLRVRVDFELVNQAQTEKARDAAVEHLTDPVLIERVRRAVAPVVERYPRDMLLVPRGQPIKERQLNLLQEEHRAYLHGLTPSDHWRRGIDLFLVFALLALLVVLYVARFQTGLAQSLPTIAGICALVLVTVALGLVLSRPPYHAVLIPLTLTAMILTIAYNPQFALLMSFSLALAMALVLGTDLGPLLIQMSGLATAVMLLRNVRTRTGLVRVAGGAGLAYCAMTIATELLSGQTSRLIFLDAGRHLLWGSLAGFLLTGSLPVVERCFGIITDITLFELADSSHPLLQELIRRAPGTYTHSMTIATLAEAAAEAIGANPLLTRVGSYFHDVGKMLKPHYFIENQTGENRHDDLEPALSTLIIIGHVKDGVALARQYNLPRPIIDFIQQHHGTTLVEYFYREALRMLEASGQGEAGTSAAPLLEPSFRYPGPKPQNRENGIVMLADAVESSSRALTDPTPNSLRKLVHDLLMKRLLDGQFEGSGLTLTELHLIEESLCKSLIALFHARIKYPDAKTRQAS